MKKKAKQVTWVPASWVCGDCRIEEWARESDDILIPIFDLFGKDGKRIGEYSTLEKAQAAALEWCSAYLSKD